MGLSPLIQEDEEDYTVEKDKNLIQEQSNEKHTISRRDFLKGAAAGAVGIAVTGLVGACAAPTSSGNEQAATPAPQTQPEVTPAPSSPAVSDTPGVPSWLGLEPQIADADITETVETEVLVIGSGMGGLFAACSAAENGAKVLLINKLGRITGLRNDLAGINSKIQQAEGIVIDKHEAVREIVKYSANRVDTRLLYLWAEESGETIDWYDERVKEHGVKLWIQAGWGNKEGKYKHFPTGHFPEWPADGSLDGGIVLTTYAEKLGVQIRHECPMVKLIKEGNKVTGVIAQDTTDDHYVRINTSKGVIVATGGYANNKEMLSALTPQTYGLTSSYAMTVAGTTGDGIKACMWAGAALDDIHTLMIFDRACIKPDTVASPDTESRWFWMGSQPFMKVDATGRRFCNESCCYDYLPHAASMLPGNSYFTIWDKNMPEHIYQLDTQGCSRMFEHENGAPPEVPFGYIAGLMEELVEEGFIIKADTIEELANGLHLPVDEFKASVERYNELNKNGEDVDFGKEKYRLTPIDSPPYYGARTCGYILCSIDGIRINTDMQALDADKNPIEGLYVVGNDSGGFFAHTYPNLFTGLAAGRTITFGRRTGRIVASL